MRNKFTVREVLSDMENRPIGIGGTSPLPKISNVNTDTSAPKLASINNIMATFFDRAGDIQQTAFNPSTSAALVGSETAKLPIYNT